MTTYGIDVSKWQGNINWLAVKESGKVDFAILKIGSGRLASQKDKTFEKNYTGAKANSIPIGGYWYSYAMSADEAIQEANACLECIKGKRFEYPIYFDVEEDKQLRLGKTAVSNIIKAFCSTLEANGYFVGVYCSKSHLDGYVNDECRAKYTTWVAHYGVSKTTYTGPFDMWQKSDKGKISGINGNVDLDECYRDFTSTIKKLGKNGFSKPVVVETPKTETKEEVKVEVIEAAKNTNVKPVETTAKSTEKAKLFDVRIVCNALNIRTGPSLSSKSIGIARNGEVYTIIEEKNGWGKIAEKNCWISILSKYVKKL